MSSAAALWLPVPKWTHPWWARRSLWLTEVLEHISRKTSLDELSLVILGDHGHLNWKGSLSVNKLFAERGWVNVPFPEKRSDCRAFCHAASVSAQVYVNDPTICKIFGLEHEEMKGTSLL